MKYVYLRKLNLEVIRSYENELIIQLSKLWTYSNKKFSTSLFWFKSAMFFFTVKLTFQLHLMREYFCIKNHILNKNTCKRNKSYWKCCSTALFIRVCSLSSSIRERPSGITSTFTFCFCVSCNYVCSMTRVLKFHLRGLDLSLIAFFARCIVVSEMPPLKYAAKCRIHVILRDNSSFLKLTFHS